MTVNIPLTGIDPTSPIPGSYAEFKVAQGDSGGQGGPTKLLILAPKTSAGTLTVDTQVGGPYTLASDVITATGAGSPAHRMFRKFFATAPASQVQVYILCPTAATGTAATDEVTFAFSSGSNPTAAGIATVTICGVPCSFAYGTSDTATTIAAGVKNAINQHTELPVTATNSLGVLTIAGKIAGTELNSIRFRSAVTASTNVTTTVTADTALGASGAGAAAIGTGTISLTAALATILGTKYDYIVSHVQESTPIDALMDQVETQALPATGFLQQVIFGSALSVANATTLASGSSLNRFQGQLVQQKESPEEHYLLAAGMAAVRTLYEIPNPSYNFNLYGTKAGQVNPFSAPYNASAAPGTSDQTSMLSNGVTPIIVAPNGTACVLRSITTRCKDGSGNFDYRARNTNIVTTGMRFTNQLRTILAQRSWDKITEDPADTTSKQPDALFATPKRVKSTVETLVRDYVDAGWLDPAKESTIIASVVTGVNSVSANRMDTSLPLFSAIWLNAYATLVNESSPSL